MKITALIAAAGLLALSGQAHAQTINFDDVQDGTVINSTYSPLGITFTGETPFSQQVQATTAAAAFPPGSGPFATNALDATHGLVDVLLDPNTFTYGLSSFQVTSLADPMGFGSTSVKFDFLGPNGVLIYSSGPFDQTKTQTVTFADLAGVQKIVLPADAYYDDFSFRPAAAPVPEAGTAVSFTALLALGGFAVLRRRSLAAR